MSVPLILLCVFSLVISVLADEDLLKSVLECSVLMVSHWKVDHQLDTEEDVTVGISSEDEAEDLEPAPGVARCRSGGHAPTPPEPHPAAEDNKVVVKERALKWVKQQVSALLHVEDLPEGAQAREVTEVPYQIPAIPREGKDCPVCQQSFKTHHHLMVHMGVHRGEEYPCTRCGKVLTKRKMWSRHTMSCVKGHKVSCPDCGKQYASTQGMKQYHRAKHGADAPELDEHYVCPFCRKFYRIKKSWAEHKPYCPQNPDHKGPYYCRVTGCSTADHPFSRMRNLNFHMSNIHGWKERWA